MIRIRYSQLIRGVGNVAGFPSKCGSRSASLNNAVLNLSHFPILYMASCGLYVRDVRRRRCQRAEYEESQENKALYRGSHSIAGFDRIYVFVYFDRIS